MFTISYHTNAVAAAVVCNQQMVNRCKSVIRKEDDAVHWHDGYKREEGIFEYRYDFEVYQKFAPLSRRGGNE